MNTTHHKTPSRLTLSDRLNTHFRKLVANLPREKCMAPQNAHEALNQLEQMAASDLEIILSYGTYSTQRMSSFGNNPLGHIAIRIDDQVYTLNGLALLGEDEKLVLNSNLETYLYGTQKPTANSFLGDSFGNSYIQNAISLRVSEIEIARKQKMKAEVQRLNTEFARGNLRYSYTSFNCASFVDSVLRAGDIQVFSELQRFFFNALPLPLDLFAAALQSHLMELARHQDMKLVSYPQISQGSRLITGFRFPISVFHPRLLLTTLAQRKHLKSSTPQSNLTKKRNCYEAQVSIELIYDEINNSLKIDHST